MRILLAFVCLLSSIAALAQTGLYSADLAKLRSVLEKTPGYKKQIRGSKLTAYNELYNRLLADSANDPNSYAYFYNLAQLLFPISDNHLAFYQSMPDPQATSSYPSLLLNTDSLSNELAKKPIDSIEGIYYYDQFYSVGLFKSGRGEYTGVVLHSELPHWQKGQIAIHLYEHQPGLFKAIYGHPVNKTYILNTIEKYRNGSLLNSYFYRSYSQSTYRKQPGMPDYVNLPSTAPRFEMKQINENTQYILVRSFQTHSSVSNASQHFYDSIKNLLSAPNLILDLRNNEGGAKKEAKKYLALIKKRAKKGPVYILVNNGTLSQAELFILRLHNTKNIITIGQTTRGMLTYGSNYGKTETLPGKRFKVYLTDMGGRDELLNYEDRGIDPSIFLSADSDWIEQVTRIIKN